jgi:NitT/TauT family transport system permease protein
MAGTRLEWLSLPLLLLIWHGAAMGAASRFLPSPVLVAGEIADLVTRGHMLADFGQTLWRAAVGFVLAMLLGMGVFEGYDRMVRRA